MTDQDVMVATPPDDTMMGGRSGRSLSSSSSRPVRTGSIWSARAGCWPG